MRAAGTITGLFALYASLIPGTYSSKQEDAANLLPSATAPPSEATGQSLVGEATLDGRVFDRRGRPVKGASVSLAGSGLWPARTIGTDAEGRFHWSGIPAGIYELRASRDRLVAPPLQGLILDPGDRRAFAFQLEPGWTLAGRIVDEQTGQAIPAAKMTLVSGLLGLLARQVESDERGRFELRGIVGNEHSLYVEALGHVAAGPLRYREEDSPVLVRLQPAATIEGRVVDERGRPIEGAAVGALGEEPASRSYAPEGTGLGVTSGPVPPISAAGANPQALAGQAVTRGDGTFSLRGLRAGVYSLAIRHEDYAPAQAGSFRVTAGMARTVSDVAMQRGAELAGRVVDARGNGLEAIPVELRAHDQRVPRLALSAADGSFSFRGVRGEVSVTALPYELPPARETIRVTDEALVSVELELASELYTLRGRVVDEWGFGVSGALLTVSSNNPRTPTRRSTKSDPDGSFSVPALPEPPFSLRVEHPSFGPAHLDEIDRLDDVRVVMSAGVTLLGQVLDDWSGEGLPNAEIDLRGPVQTDAKTRPDGTFVIEQVPTGTYQVSFTHPEFEAQNRRIVVERPRYVDRPQTLETIRLEPGGTITGEILDRYNQVVARAEVTWGEPPRWDRAVWTDARGQFRLRGVPAGSIWLTARHPMAGEGSSPEAVTVRPRETSSGVYVRLPDSLRK
jgi:hypothetical protein